MAMPLSGWLILWGPTRGRSVAQWQAPKFPPKSAGCKDRLWYRLSALCHNSQRDEPQFSFLPGMASTAFMHTETGLSGCQCWDTKLSRRLKGALWKTLTSCKCICSYNGHTCSVLYPGLFSPASSKQRDHHSFRAFLVCKYTAHIEGKILKEISIKCSTAHVVYLRW